MRRWFLFVLITVPVIVVGYNFRKIEGKLDKTLQENFSLKSEVSLNTKQVEKLTLSLQEKQETIEQLRDDLSTFSKPLRLKNALTVAQGTITDLNKQVLNLRTTAQKLQSENFSLKSRVQSNGQEIVRLLEELEWSRKEIAGIETRKGERSSQLQSLQQELDTVKSRYAEVVAKRDALQTQLESSQKRKDSPQELKRLNAAIAQKESEIGSLQNELEDVRQRYLKASDERNDLQKELTSLQKEYARRQSQEEIWQKDLQELRDKLEEREQEHQKVKDQLREVTNEKEDVVRQLKVIKAREEELVGVNSKLQNQLTEISGELTQEKEKVSQLQEKLKAPQLANNEEIDFLRGRVAIQKERLDSVTTLYNRLKEQLKEVANILSQREEKLMDKEKEVELLQDEIAYLKLKLSGVENTLRQSEESQRVLIEKFSEVSKLNTALQERLSEVSGFRWKSSSLEKESTQDTSHLDEQEKGVGDEYETTSGTRAEDLKKKVEVYLEPSQ